MLLLQARQRQLQLGTALCQPLEGFVLARVVVTVGIVAQVADDVLYQLVAGPLAVVEDVELPLQQPEQTCSVCQAETGSTAVPEARETFIRPFFPEAGMRY
jgi:hypothetical protein